MIVTFSRLGRSSQSSERLTLDIPGHWPDGGPEVGDECARIYDAIHAHCRHWLMSRDFGIGLHPDGTVDVVAGFRLVGEGRISNDRRFHD